MKIAVLAGGTSNEKEISLLSAKNVLETLKELNYESELIDPTDKDFNKKIKEFDLIFNVLHGETGEDGKIQGYFELNKVPYTCSEQKTCVVCFDKFLFYELFKNKFKMPKTILTKNYIDPPFKFPIFIKPNTGGSSKGVYIVHNEVEYKEKLEKNIKIYTEVLIQEAIKGTEISISFLEKDNEFVVLPILEILPKNEFYDYEAKYKDGMTNFSIYESNKEINKKINNIKEEIFKILKLKDIFRIDAIILNDEVYVLELNTVPGLTKISDLPQSAKANNIEFNELIKIIIENHRRD
ncbi:D-alanine--D-alanine ligase [Tepiditoga spiralis]|uniref:D-alanine--D-alanine ligase n=1 Tax=Tepiditoga spiralis TaxID=2108365 RepID=A0A7G1G7V9_9BACT|nr:D-alanine--D-alanine ligase [Tepiditoga spiralis]BBE31027.1 D-alanine--D-alanine ligase [Tepiditoga spiralis]